MTIYIDLSRVLHIHKALQYIQEITFIKKKKKDRLEVNVTNLNMCLETMEIIRHITIPNSESMYNIIYSNSMSSDTNNNIQYHIDPQNKGHH